MSAAESRVRELSAQDRQKLDELLSNFHSTWEPGRLDRALHQLPVDIPYRLAAVTGLAAIDLEMRWQKGDYVRVEEYLEKYPELGTPDNVSVELLLAEYFSHERYESAPDFTAFLSRFPQQADDVRRLVTLAKSPRVSGHRSKPSGNTSIHAQQAEDGPQLPEQFDRYRIQKKLGQGGMGTVYLAYDTRLDRKVALKVPKFAPGHNAENLERFYREARATATITHPNLCPLYDVGEINGTPYLTMAYIEGWPLSKFIRPDKLLPQFGVATVTRIVAQAIGEAHKRGVIHRDLKPGNIMINKRGEPIVMDFGLARWVNADKEDIRLTRSGAILGAPVYMSPEQVYGDVEVMGPGCDVYSLGVILYELLTGRLPFEGPTTAVLAKTLIQPPKPPSAYRADVDKRLEAICLKAMAKKISERYGSMAELAAALTDYIRTERQVQTLSSLSATGMGNGSSVSLAGPPQSTTTGSSKRKKQTANTIGIAGSGIQTQVDEDVVALGEPVSLPLPAPSSMTVSKPQGSKALLWAGIMGACVMAAALVVGIALWILLGHSGKVNPSTSPATHEASLFIALQDLPDDAEVRVNDEVVNRARLEKPLSLQPGRYRILVTADKFEPWSDNVNVAEGENAPVRVQLKPKKEAVAVKPPEPGEPVPGLPFEGHEGAIRALAWSGDGQTILSGGDDFTLRLWDPGTRAVKKRFEATNSAVTGAALSRDGKRALSGAASGVVTVWDANTGKSLRQMPGHTDAVRAVAISSDGKWGLSGGADGTMRLWDLDRGVQKFQYPGHSGAVWSVAFSADGQQVASGCEDRVVRVWNREAPTQPKLLKGHFGPVHAVTILFDGRVLSASDDRTLRLWNVESKTTKALLIGHAGKVRGLAATSDGKRAVSTGFGDDDNALRLWDLETGKLIHGVGLTPKEIYCVAFAPNDRWVIAGGADGIIRLWDSTKQMVEPLPGYAPPEVTKETQLLQAAYIPSPGSAPKANFIEQIAFTPDGKFVLWSGDDKKVHVYELAKKQVVATYTEHSDGIRGFAILPDSRRVLSAGYDKTLRLWEFKGDTTTEIRAFNGHTSRITCVWLSKDGKRAVSSGDDKTVRIWDVDTGMELQKMEGHSGAMFAAVLTSDGEEAISAGMGAGDHTIRRWNVNTGQEIARWKTEQDVHSMALSPDGRLLLAGGKQGMLQVWERETGNLLATYVGHTNNVTCCRFSPDGRWVLSCTSGAGPNEESSLRLWNVETAQEMVRYNPYTSSNRKGMKSCAFSPDGRYAVCGDSIGAVRLWALPEYVAGSAPR